MSVVVTPTTKPQDLPEYLTVREFQTYFRIGRSLVYKLLTQGRIEGVRVGRRWLIPKRALHKLDACQ